MSYQSYALLIEMMKNTMSKEMFKYINQGCSRKVYAINDDVVIKVAMSLHEDPKQWGIKQCQTELQTYIKYGDKFPLCKIFVDMCTDERIIMERITPVDDLISSKSELDGLSCLIRKIKNLIFVEFTQDELDSLSPIVRKFVDKILNSGLTYLEIRSILTDVDSTNMGVKDNELLILDYGIVSII